MRHQLEFRVTRGEPLPEQSAAGREVRLPADRDRAPPGELRNTVDLNSFTASFATALPMRPWIGGALRRLSAALG
jgi:hypothetical protein